MHACITSYRNYYTRGDYSIRNSVSSFKEMVMLVVREHKSYKVKVVNVAYYMLCIFNCIYTAIGVS